MKRSVSSYLLLIGAYFSMNYSLLAQSPINISASVGGGFSVPQSSALKGQIGGSYDYALSKTGYTLAGKVRLGLQAAPVAVVGTLSYNSLSNEGFLPATSPITFSNSLSIFALGIGIEYEFLPTPLAQPYISALGTVNFINGKAAISDNILPEANLNSTSRLGLDLGLGSQIAIPSFPFSFDVQAQYHLVNLAGKEFVNTGSTYPVISGIPLVPHYNLNDAANPNDPKDHARPINYFTFTVGLTFVVL